MEPIDVKINKYIGFEVEDNDKDPKSKVDDHERISKYKNIYQRLHPKLVRSFCY